jgi:FAD/FMN-containing dehydrogenase
MPGGGEGRTGLLSPPPPPEGFRGAWAGGEEARALAARVAGPFRGVPAAYAAPVDAEDLSLLVLHARALGIPLVPRGAGTAMPGGNLGSGIVVSLAEGFRAMDAPRPDGTVRAGAGVVAGRLEAGAAAAGLTLPALPSSAPWATLGGMAACNAAGARSFGHGAMDRFVVALEGIAADGSPVRLGPGGIRGTLPGGPLPELAPPEIGLPAGGPALGELRKNSSGYGIDRWRRSGNPAQLGVGSEGTLLVVTGVELRLAPFPPCRGLLLVAVSDGAGARDLSLAAAELEASACEFLGRRLLEMAGLADDPELGPVARGAFALFLLEFEADSPRALVARLEAARRRTGAMGSAGITATDPAAMARLWSLRRRASPLIAAEAGRGRISTQFIEDSVVPVPALDRYLAELDRILREEEMDAVVFGHAGDGNLHVNPLVDLSLPDWEPRVRRVLDGVVELVAGLGGTLAGEHGDGHLRAPFLHRIWGDDWTEAFRRLRQAFDPQGILNPGVILPLPGQDPLERFHPRARDWPPSGRAGEERGDG